MPQQSKADFSCGSMPHLIVSVDCTPMADRVHCAGIRIRAPLHISRLPASPDRSRSPSRLVFVLLVLPSVCCSGPSFLFCGPAVCVNEEGGDSVASLLIYLLLVLICGLPRPSSQCLLLASKFFFTPFLHYLL